MIAAPIPSNDTQRLADLHSLGLLDTPPEERFDRITRLLARVMRVPMAYISLVDTDRQWFKSSCGLSSRQTPRAVSFCGHAILTDEPMIVSDASHDERFRDNPLVTGDPFIRFYAGHPLAGPDGYKVGTLCIADRQPRTLQSGEVEVLGEIARLVERELGLMEIAYLQRSLLDGQEYLIRELNQAVRYVRSLLPEPILEGDVRARWRFEPSSRLGGDCFGYEWIDPEHFAIYLLDVSGHGVGAALLSVSITNTLRTRSLPDTNFLDPASVLARLNDAFQMDRHDEKYFTIWYGIFNRTSRTLAYSSGGHPPALLLTGPTPDRAHSVTLDAASLPIGMVPGSTDSSTTVSLEPFSRLFVFSDGAYEVTKPDGTMMQWQDLATFLAASPNSLNPDDVLRFVQRTGQSEILADDFSLLEIDFR